MIPVPFWALTQSQKVWRRGENGWFKLGVVMVFLPGIGHCCMSVSCQKVELI